MKFKPYNKSNNKPKLHIIINIIFLSKKKSGNFNKSLKNFIHSFFSSSDYLNFNDREKIKLMLKASENGS